MVVFYLHTMVEVLTPHHGEVPTPHHGRTPAVHTRIRTFLVESSNEQCQRQENQCSQSCRTRWNIAEQEKRDRERPSPGHSRRCSRSPFCYSQAIGSVLRFWRIAPEFQCAHLVHTWCALGAHLVRRSNVENGKRLRKHRYI